MIVLCRPAAAQSPAVAPAQPPVTWLIFIDDLHLDFRNTGRIRDALKTIAAQLLAEDDRFAIISSGPSGVAVDLTSDRELLNGAIRRTTGNALRFSDVLDRNGAAEANYRASIALATVKSLIDAPSLPFGSKALLYISNGYDFEILPDAAPMPMPRGQRTSTRAEVRAQLTELRAAATNASVRVFAIDPRVAINGSDLDAQQPEWASHQEAKRTALRSISENGFAIVDGDFVKQLKQIADAVRNMQ